MYNEELARPGFLEHAGVLVPEVASCRCLELTNHLADGLHPQVALLGIGCFEAQHCKGRIHLRV